MKVQKHRARKPVFNGRLPSPIGWGYGDIFIANIGEYRIEFTREDVAALAATVARYPYDLNTPEGREHDRGRTNG